MADDNAAQLTVRIPELGPGLHPTVSIVDAQSLELVASGFAGQQLRLPPGHYVVSSILPSGEQLRSVADVVPGVDTEISLATTRSSSSSSLPATEWVPARERPSPRGRSLLYRPVLRVTRLFDYLGGRRRVGGAPVGERVELNADLDAELEIGPLAVVNPFFLRFVRLRDNQTKPIEVAGAVVVEAGAEVSIDVTPEVGQGVVFAQLLVDEEPVLNVALPADGEPGSPSCRLAISTEPLAAAVSRPENKSVDAIGRYLNTGNLRQAATLASKAERLLESKMADPFGAALGALALLRMGELKRLHDWPRNLANWFDWLPDGAIVAGELNARRGRHAAAVADFLAAAERGLPTFADAFSILASRLRQYNQAETLDLPPDERKQLAVQAARVVPLSSLVDFARVSLAFRGARLEDPFASLDERPKTLGADGWHRFSPLSRTLEPCN